MAARDDVPVEVVFPRRPAIPPQVERNGPADRTRRNLPAPEGFSAAERAVGAGCLVGPPARARQAAVLCGTPFSCISVVSSPDWNISSTMSQPPTNSPFT